jgi:dihydrofolate synthase/folylpolyglutamate synthase
LEYVIGQLKRLPAKKLHMVIGFVNDKDLSGVLPLFPKDAVYYFTKASVPRALNEEVLMQKASEFGLNGNSYTEVKIAMKAAVEKAAKGDVIFIGGSTFVVADCL